MGCHMCDVCASDAMSMNQPDIMRSETSRLAEAKPLRSDQRDQACVGIILAGGLAPSPLNAMTCRSVLDLHVTSSETLLDSWQRALQAVGVAETAVVHGGCVPVPSQDGPGIRIMCDEDLYRGPAGAARDAWERLGAPARVVIGDGDRWVGASLRRLQEHHERSGADVTVGMNQDQSSAGVYIADPTALDCIPRVGYVDLKEQWLPRVLSSGLDVRGVGLGGYGSHRIETLSEFLGACRIAAGPDSSDPWRVVCRGARVMRGTDVVDSIVMPGGVVEDGATVARSLVLPGARVESGQILVDGVARPEGLSGANGTLPRRLHVARDDQLQAREQSTAFGTRRPESARSADIAA